METCKQHRRRWTDLGSSTVQVGMHSNSIRPQRPTAVELGDWQHGWHNYSSSSSEHNFRDTVVLAQSCAADQAHLRCASLVLCGSPTSREFTVKPHLFRTIILERLRLPLFVTDAMCECSAVLDARGPHRAACPRSGSNRAHPGLSLPGFRRHNEVQR